MKKQRIQLNKFETSHQIKLYKEKQQKKDLPEPSDAELENSPADGGTDKQLSQLSADERFEVMPVYSGAPPNWNHPTTVGELATLIENQIVDALTDSCAERVIDKKFLKQLEICMNYKDEEFIEENIRKFIAKHQTPA